MKAIKKYYTIGLVLFLAIPLNSINAQCNIGILDDFSNDTRTSYVTDTESGDFDLPENNWRIENQRLYPAPVERSQQWNNNPDTKRSAKVYRKNERLEAGKAIAITIG